jgi:hypothetical protein
MGSAGWTPTAEDELTDIAYRIAVEDGRPITANPCEHGIDVLRVVDTSRDFSRLFA